MAPSGFNVSCGLPDIMTCPSKRGGTYTKLRIVEINSVAFDS